MFRIAICDDEIKHSVQLKKIIMRYLNKKNILFQIDVYDSGTEFVSLGLRMAKYQVVFLDINMEQKKGIEIAICFKKICKNKFLVLVTACTDYILEGYKMGAFRYLIKGNDDLEDNICESLDAVFEKIDSLSYIKEFQFKDFTKKIALEHIIYIESHLHELFFHILENELVTYTMTETLNRIEKKLPMKEFVRIHQSYLVNLRYIITIKSHSVVLVDGNRLAIAKSRYKEVKKKFVDYHANHKTFSRL